MSERPPILNELIALAAQYAARPAGPDDRIYADLDINGGDFIEFVEEVERRYAVDLSLLSPRSNQALAQDITIKALGEAVQRQNS